MKVLFCLPHQTVISKGKENYHSPTISLPLGVLSMAAFLRKENWPGEMEIYDARLSGKTTYISGKGTFFGDSLEEISAAIKKAQPDVVAISNMWSWQIDCALDMADLVKKVNPNIITVLGGPHASSFPEEMIAHKDLDFVAMGEGEERFLALLQCLEKGEVPQIEGILGEKEDIALLKSSNAKHAEQNSSPSVFHFPHRRHLHFIQ